MTNEMQAITVGNQPGKLKEYIRSEEIMLRFKEVLGDYQASAYVSSVVLAVANSPVLQECTPLSIVSSALRAASLRLSCDPSTGQAYLVPFGDHGVKKATLIVGYKGLYHMALRTNKYRDINVSPVYDGEVVTENRITGMHSLDGGKLSSKVVGYIGYFELLSGFRKTVYMTLDEIHAHAQKKSKGYNRTDSAWKTDTAMMEKKTVLRLMLSHWGYFDPHDAMALESLEVENEGVEILPETVTVEDEPKRDLEQSISLWDNDPQPTQPAQPAPLRVDIHDTDAAYVRNSNTTDAPASGTPTSGNGHDAPVYTGQTCKIGKNTYPYEWGVAFADPKVGIFGRIKPPHVDGILQKLELDPHTRADVVRSILIAYEDAKDRGADPVAAANDRYVAAADGRDELG